MRAKTVLTETGPGRIEMPGSGTARPGPVIVRERQRRLDGMSQIALSLTARGLTAGEIAAHLEEVYGVRVSKDMVSGFTGKVIGEMAEWCNWPLDRAYPVLAQSRSWPSRKEF